MGAFIYYGFAFHITMLPAFVLAPLIVLVLWFFIAWPYRSVFAPILCAKP